MKKGFTLIELLIVIAILAILTTAVVLVLNPAQILAEARDSQRTADLDTVMSAINLYLATATSTTLGEAARSTANTTCGLNGASGEGVTCALTAVYTVAGAGWVGVDLTLASGGSPLAVLPRDPLNNATYQYAYDGKNTEKTFELNGRLESVKFRGKMANDGGDDSTCATYTEGTCYYEIGTEPGLDL